MNLLLLLSTLISPPANAAPPRGGAVFGIGVGGGLGVSGLSGKFWLKDGNAVQVVVGAWGVGRYDWGYGYGYGFGASADFLWAMPVLARAEALILAWNLGAGASVGATNPEWFGVSGVAGLEFNIQPAPIDITLEYRPGFAILPGFGPDLINFTGHARVHF